MRVINTTNEEINMSNISFDTLEYTNTLKESGFTQQQAEGMTKATSDILVDFKNNSDLATKVDIHQLKNELKSDIQEVRNELKSEIKDFKVDIHKTLLTMTLGLIGAMAALQTIFHFIK